MSLTYAQQQVPHEFAGNVCALDLGHWLEECRRIRRETASRSFWASRGVGAATIARATPMSSSVVIGSASSFSRRPTLLAVANIVYSVQLVLFSSSTRRI